MTKNIKKFSSIFIITALVVSLLGTPVQGAATADALKLETIGILLGTGSGVNTAYRESVPTRYQAAWLFLRLLGKESAAKIRSETLNFKDAATAKNTSGSTLNSENQKMLAYLYTHQTLGFRGYTDDTFRPFTAVNAQMYYKLMLTALGYVEGIDYTWDTVFQKVVEYGLRSTAPGNSDVFDIDALAQATVEALGTELKSGGKTLITKLVETDRVIDALKASQAGLYDGIALLEPAVEGIFATNLGEVNIKFNKEIDGSTLTGNITIGGTAATAELGSDGKTAIVTVPTAKLQTNGGSYAIVISKNVTDLAGKGLTAAYSATVQVFDKTPPAVSSITLKSPNTFEITFTEILNSSTRGSVRINGGVWGIANITISGKTATVTIAATSLRAATYDVEISNFKDLAGFIMEKEVRKWAYIPDTTTPTVSIKSVTQTTAIIEFSEPVTNAQVLTDYYHTFPTYTATAVTKDSDTLYMVVFGRNPIPVGTATLTIRNNNIKDSWGNAMSSGQTFTINVSADLKAPTVTEIKFINEKTVEVYFSENVNRDDAETVTNFPTRLSSVNKNANSAVYDNAAMKTTLTWNTTLVGGSYAITVQNIRDLAFVPNTLLTYWGSFTVTDKTPVDTAKVTATMILGGANDLIFVSYPEAMNRTVLNRQSYMLRYPNGTETLLSPSTKIEEFGSQYKITMPHDPNLTANGSSKLIIGKVEDASGNAVAALSFYVTINAEIAPAIVPGSLRQITANRLSVQFDKVLAKAERDAFIVRIGATDYKAAVVDTIAVNEGVTSVVFTLTGDTVAAITAIRSDYETNTGEIIGSGDLAVVQIHLDGDYILSETGMKAADADLTGTVVDGRPPVYISARPISDYGIYFIEITFSEDISGVNVLYYAYDLVVLSANGTRLSTPGIDYSTTVVNGKLRAEIVGQTSLNCYVGSNDTITHIKGSDGIKIAPFTQVRAIGTIAVIHGPAYTQGLDPLYSAAENAFIGKGYSLVGSYTDSVTIQFDMTPLVDDVDGSVNFAGTDLIVEGYGQFSMQIRMSGGFIDARNGAWQQKIADVAVVKNQRYHIRVFADMNAHTYDVYATAPGDAAVLIANDFGFRSNIPAAANANDVGQFFITSASQGDLKVENLTIVKNP